MRNIIQEKPKAEEMINVPAEKSLKIVKTKGVFKTPFCLIKTFEF